MPIGPYTAVAVQANYIVVNDRAEIVKRVVPRYLELIDHSIEWYGLYGPRVGNPPIRLFVFPEFMLQGWDYFHSPTFAHIARNTYGSQREGLRVAVEIPGQETAVLGEKAREHGVFIAGAALEYDPEWPDRFFNCAFIVGPTGELIHKYRKLNTTNHLIGVSTSPYDILDEYMTRYGNGRSITEVLFPVTETEIGRIGTYICYDGFFPEVPRALALQGAEVLIRPIQWYTAVFPTVGVEPYRINNQMRAYDNCAYVISATSARTISTSENPTIVPEQWCSGHSMIVSHSGQVIAEGESLGEEVVMGTIDIEDLRQRRSASLLNLPAQLPTQVFQDVYERIASTGLAHRPNQPKDTIEDSRQQVEEAIARFFEAGIYAH